MPMYDYRCPECKGNFEAFASMRTVKQQEICPNCGALADKQISCPNLITDTNFCGTGVYDDRVCDNRDDKIRGRKDWKRRLKKKGLRELDWAELKPRMPKPAACM